MNPQDADMAEQDYPRPEPKGCMFDTVGTLLIGGMVFGIFLYAWLSGPVDVVL